MAAMAAAETNRWGVEHVDEVSVLTNNNFDTFINSNKHVFVKFYAPWCGHCKAMAPGYAKLAAKMTAREDGIPIAKVDATENEDVASRFGIEGYPTLKLFVDGEPVDYDGEREEGAIENWINKKLNPSSKQLTKVEELAELDSVKLALVMVTAEPEADQLNAFNQFSTNVDVPVYNAAFLEAMEVTGSTKKYNFVMYRNFDEGRQVLSSNEMITVAQMKEFFDNLRFPTLMEFDQEVAEKIFGGEHTAIFFFTENPESEDLKVFAEVAKERKSDMFFSKSSITEGLGERLSEYLGVTLEDEGSVRIVKFVGESVVKYQLKKVTKEALIQFLDDFKANTLTPHYKSEPVPETNDQPVKVIVGETFKEMIVDSDKWVLLEVYAPWCGHCKKLAPIYDQLAAKLVPFEDIVIAKMDGTTNEHELVAIKGFPTIKFFRKGDKTNPIDFEGDRTLEGFMSFLAKETSLALPEVESAEVQEDL